MRNEKDITCLVIERKEGQAFWVGDARIMFYNKYLDRYKVVIEAPREVTIMRDEVKERLEQKKNAD